MVRYTDIALAAQKSARARYCAIAMRNLRRITAEYLMQTRRDEFHIRAARLAMLEGIYDVLLDNADLDTSITYILTDAFGYKDVTNYSSPNSKTAVVLNEVADKILLSDERLSSFDSELRRVRIVKENNIKKVSMKFRYF